MKFRLARFNIYFFVGLVLLLAACQTTEERKRKKEASTLRLHLEVNPTTADRAMQVSVYRKEPILVMVDREPFLDEGDVDQAWVTPALGGYAIKIQFNRHGTWILENVTTASRAKKIAVFSQFGESRWLAAPVINKRAANGAFVFTPDASFEECERMVRGLNNVAEGLRKKNSRW